MGADPSPVISVVMASDRAGVELARCLDSLCNQNFVEPFETLVAGPSAESRYFMAPRYPEVRFLCFEEELSKPQLL
jgi:hypothetical protein